MGGIYFLLLYFTLINGQGIPSNFISPVEFMNAGIVEDLNRCITNTGDSSAGVHQNNEGALYCYKRSEQLFHPTAYWTFGVGDFAGYEIQKVGFAATECLEGSHLHSLLNYKQLQGQTRSQDDFTFEGIFTDTIKFDYQLSCHRGGKHHGNTGNTCYIHAYLDYHDRPDSCWGTTPYTHFLFFWLAPEMWQQTNKLENLNQGFAQLETDMAALTIEVSDLSDEVSDLDIKVEGYGDSIDQLTIDVSDLGDEVQTLSLQVEEVVADIDTLQTEFDTHVTQNGNDHTYYTAELEAAHGQGASILNGRVDSLDNSLGVNNESHYIHLEESEADHGVFRVDITTNTENIGQLQSDLIALEGRVDIVEPVVNENTQHIANNKDDIALNTAAISDNGIAIGNNAAAIEENVQELADHDTRITQLDQDQGDHSDLLDTHAIYHTEHNATFDEHAIELDAQAQVNAEQTAAIDDLQSRVTQNEEDIANMTVTDEDFADLVDRVDVLEIDSQAMLAAWADMPTEMALLQADIDDNADNIADNTQAIVNIDTQVNTNIDEILLNTQNIAALEYRVIDNEQDILTNHDNIVINQEDIVTLQTNITDIDGRVWENYDHIIVHHDEIAALENNDDLTDLTNRVIQNEDDIESNEDRIVQLEQGGGGAIPTSDEQAKFYHAMGSSGAIGDLLDNADFEWNYPHQSSADLIVGSRGVKMDFLNLKSYTHNWEDKNYVIAGSSIIDLHCHNNNTCTFSGHCLTICGDDVIGSPPRNIVHGDPTYVNSGSGLITVNCKTPLDRFDWSSTCNTVALYLSSDVLYLPHTGEHPI